ncbi:MAG: SpoIID/LytB domain-containing protein [Phycisphaerales bacterium]|jgi:SpoIID/LytB domain protein|nr:SpoIID/LytB domain-containing protein [Phycisphaerales bacterium]
MFSHPFHHLACNRREFLASTGVFLVGGLSSCAPRDQHDKKTSTTPQAKKHTIPTSEVHIRVRIGKVRGAEIAVVDGEHVQRNDNRWVVSATSPLCEFPVDGGVCSVVEHRDHTVVVGKKTRRFTGTMKLHPRRDISAHAFDIVAHVPLESYIPGVIAGELFSHWHLNTFAAQAVAARSYAYAQHVQRLDKSHFDVTDGPSSQVFLGDVSLDVAHRATELTNNVFLSWREEVIPAYYSSCCGGFAASAIDEISSAPIHNIVPLQGREGKDVCTSLGVHKWEVERPHRSFKKRIVHWAESVHDSTLSNIASIQSIQHSKTNKNGRPTSLTFIDRKKGAWTINAKHFVHAANATIPNISDPTPRLWSSNVQATRVGTSLLFKGVGMGHGVGMCQYGAQVLAEQNKNWEEILEWYYPKSTIT